MSSRRLFGILRRIGAVSFRGFAVLAIAAKLLVPVGYMPASLADGGPITLCSTGLLPAADAPMDHGRAAGHGHDTAEQGEAPDRSHDQWERCSLGGLAGLAAIVSEWNLSLEVAAPGRIIPPANFYLPAGATLAFRARAPPFVNA